MNRYTERIYNGTVKENPTLVLMLGMCPTLAVTTTASNGLGMGISTLAVLVASSMIISLLRNVISNRIRIPAYIVIVASLVTVVQMLLQAYFSGLYDTLGIYIPLIVVNCIILGRAESYASKNTVGMSFFDGIGMGLGFTIALTLIGLLREVIGSGMIFGASLSQGAPFEYEPISIFVLAPGAFFVVAVLTAVQNRLMLPGATNGKKKGAKQ